MASFEIAIVTPEGAAYIGQCHQAIVPGSEGVFGILANHMNLISSIVPGEIVIEGDSGENKKFIVSDGIAEVSNNSLSILVENAIDSAKANKAKLLEDLSKVESQISTSQSELIIKSLNNKKTYLELAIACAN